VKRVGRTLKRTKRWQKITLLDTCKNIASSSKKEIGHYRTRTYISCRARLGELQVQLNVQAEDLLQTQNSDAVKHGSRDMRQSLSFVGCERHTIRPSVR
jgi:hypothetical protein